MKHLNLNNKTRKRQGYDTIDAYMFIPDLEQSLRDVMNQDRFENQPVGKDRSLPPAIVFADLEARVTGNLPNIY